MKLAIMQPYLLPYLGYFQLIQAVDEFLVYDDIAYRRGGWINRNYIIAKDRRQILTMPVSGGSQNRLINQVEIAIDNKKLLKTIQHCYARAPHFDAIYPLLVEILTYPEKNLALFLDYQLKKICDYLGLKPRWELSSNIEKNTLLRGQEKIISICEKRGADHYVNLPGGVELYENSKFSERGIQLSFIQPNIGKYKQFHSLFEPNLSIVDVLMFNGLEGTRRLLEDYDIKTAANK